VADDPQARRRRGGWDAEAYRSVTPGRTNDRVAAGPDAQWTGEGDGRPCDRRLAFEPVDAELRALGKLGKEGTWAVGGVEVHLTNLDKPLFPPRDGGTGKPLTKRDLVRHHATVAPAMLPYLAGRAVNPHRFPDGVTKPATTKRSRRTRPSG
jgi:bifunctional non-homologous end joining protein LigD